MSGLAVGKASDPTIYRSDPGATKRALPSLYQEVGGAQREKSLKVKGISSPALKRDK